MKHESLEGFPVIIDVPVRWGDMDAYQHVNNTEYFTYFESARIAYFQQTFDVGTRGMPEGVGPILASASCRFLAPVTYPDRLFVGARVVSLQEDRFEMEYLAVSESLNRLAAKGEALVVTYDYTEQRKAPVPDDWRSAMRAIEGGQL